MPVENRTTFEIFTMSAAMARDGFIDGHQLIRVFGYMNDDLITMGEGVQMMQEMVDVASIKGIKERNTCK